MKKPRKLVALPIVAALASLGALMPAQSAHAEAPAEVVPMASCPPSFTSAKVKPGGTGIYRLQGSSLVLVATAPANYGICTKITAIINGTKWATFTYNGTSAYILESRLIYAIN